MLPGDYNRDRGEGEIMGLGIGPPGSRWHYKENLTGRIGGLSLGIISPVQASKEP